jgi:hypothetical protein
MTCDQAREWIPLYAARALPDAEGVALVEHVVGCAACQGELVETMRLAHELRKAFAQLPGPPEGTWLAISTRTLGVPLLWVGLGSKIAGLTVDVRATNTGVPISGSLSILGREVPVLRI